MVTPRVSIILPCRNEARSIEKCLHSLLAQAPVEGGMEIIVADGLSEDATRAILEKLSNVDGSSKMEDRAPARGEDGRLKIEDRPSACDDGSPLSPLPSPIAHRPSLTGPEASGFRSHPSSLRVIDNPDRITPTGLNAAIRAARGNIIIRMDAHTEYAPDYVQKCLEVLEQTGADNVGGPARTKAETYMQKAVAAAYHSSFSVGGARFHDVDYEGWVDTVTYGCWRKESFDKFGYFDEELVRNQDDEHNLRIIRGGGRIYQSPRIRSWYRPRGSLTALFKQYMQYGYWKARVIQKHKLPASWRHLVPGAFVFTLALLFLLSILTFLLSSLGLASHLRPPTSGLWAHLPSPISHLPSLAFGTWLFTLSAYLIAILAASLHTAWKTEWKLLPILPLVFPCYHLGYGYGFLRGLWDFVIRRKRPQPQFAALTR